MPKISLSRKADLAAASLLTLLCVVLFADVLFGRRDLFIRDLTRYYHPTKSIVREIVLSGEFPWWNPYYSAGQPMAANPEYEVFYPLQWLIFLPGFETWFRLHILIHVWLAAIGMYAFLRSIRLGIPAALFGAISWGFGGLTLSLVNLLPILFAAAWMPLVLLFARRCLRRFTIRDAAAASLVGGIQILVGEPTTLVQTWLLVGLYAMWRMIRLRRRGWRALADPVAVVSLLLVWSVAIGSVQLVPAIDHADDTVRSRGFDLDLVTAWSFPPQRVLELVYPHAFGRMNVDGRTLYWSGSGLYDRPASPFFFSIYMGAMIFALVCAGSFTKRSGRARWIVLVAPFLLLALGGHTPLFDWMIDLDVPVPFRYPEKFLLAVVFATAVWGAILFGRVRLGDRRLAQRAAWVMLGFGILAVLASVASVTPLYTSAFGSLWGVESSRFRDAMVAASRLDWFLATLVIGATGSLLWLRSTGKIVVSWAPLAIGLLFVELVPIGLDASPRIQRSFYDPPSTLKAVRGDRNRFRIFHEVDWYGRSKTARKWFSSGRGVYWVVRNGLFPMTPANYGFRTVLERDYDRTALLPTVDLVRSMWDVRDGGQKDWASIFMEMSNAGYRARYRNRDSVLEDFDGDWRTIAPVAFDEVDLEPRYYLAEHLVRIGSRDEFVQSLIREVPRKRTAFVDLEPFEPANGSVEVASETSSEVHLRVNAEGKTFLVASVTPHRYWHAEIDGVPAQLHVANVGYQGLVVPEGTSDVVLSYSNPVVLAMAPVSGSALLLALGLVFLRWPIAGRGGSAGRRDAETEAGTDRVEQHERRIAADRDA